MQKKSLPAWVTALVLTVLFAGCSTAGSRSKPTAPKPEVIRQRGWIGGNYELATRGGFWMTDAIYALPGPLTNSYKKGLLITNLGSNSPVRLAGLQEGDLLLEINHQPVKKLRDLQRMVDRLEPGTVLPVTAWRDGQTNDYSVPVGRETYKTEGNFSICLDVSYPIHLGNLDFLPDPDFDLLALGLKHDCVDRHDLRSVEAGYLNKYGGSQYEPYERDWHAWLVIFHLERGKKIISQEKVPLRDDSPASMTPAKPAN